MTRISIDKQNAEILLQSVISVEPRRTVGKRTPNLVKMKTTKQIRRCDENRELSPKSRLLNLSEKYNAH